MDFQCVKLLTLAKRYILIADSKKAEEILGWKPQITELEDIVESAWNWHKKIHS